MQLQLLLNNKKYYIHNAAIDISIPLTFNGPQPNTYGVPQAQSQAFEGGGFVGDVRRGGSCNFESYTFIPHCNGTHTECIGHITEARISVHERLKDTFIPATLITVEPVAPAATTDTYLPALHTEDRLITQAALARALAPFDADFRQAIIIRTLPNEAEKMHCDYTQVAPAFFSIEAMEYIRAQAVQHLLTDTPSLDRLHDEGRLTAHHIFFEIEKGEHTEPRSIPYTITEFIYAPDTVADGIYLLNLQIAPFVSDAAPSRPRLFELR